MKSSSDDVDYGILAQEAAERRLAALMESLDAEDNDEFERLIADLDPPVEYLYDGCSTCDIRETLIAAWPFLRRAARIEAGLPDDG